MVRSALCLCLSLHLTVVGKSAPAPDQRKVPSADEIRQAIENLGNKRFEKRKNAKRFLLEAGEVAEPFLKEAAAGSDFETANAAKTVLEEFQWGLYPDIPKEIRDRIDEFRSGSPDQRRNAIVALHQHKPVPFRTIRRLAAKEDDPEQRQRMFQSMNAATISAMPALLASGALDEAEEMLELTLAGMPALAGPNYAALLYLRGKLDVAIAKFEKERRLAGKVGQHAAEILVYLYRAKGDLARARQAASDSENDALVDRMLWVARDWKGLSERPSRHIGLQACYARLSGKQKELDETIEQIKKQAESSDEAYELRRYAIALMFNYRYKEAIDLLVDKQKNRSLAFDLLCTQMKFREAFELVDEPMASDDVAFQVRRARMLYLLGERDAAIQLFHKLAGEAKNYISTLVKIEMELALRDLAIDHAALAIADLRRQEMPVDDLLNPIFGDNVIFVPVWLGAFANEDSSVVLRRIHKIYAGKVERKQLVEWCEKLLRTREMGTDQTPDFKEVDAVAAAYKAIGDAAKAGEYLKLALDKQPTPRRGIAYGDFLMEQKKYKEAARAYASAAKTRKAPVVSPDEDLLPKLPGQPGRSLMVSDPEEFSPALATYLGGRALLLAGDDKEGRRLIELAHWMPLGDDTLRCKLARQLKRRVLPELGNKESDMLLKTGYYTDYHYGNMLDFLGEEAFRRRDYSTAVNYYDSIMVGISRTSAKLLDPGANLRLPEMIAGFRTLHKLADGKVDEAVKEALANQENIQGMEVYLTAMVLDLEKLGKKKEADAIYRKVLNLREKLCKDYPNSGFAHNSVAAFMAGCRRDLDAALKHAKKAAELESENANYLDTVAEVHFRQGDRDKALRLMKTCIEMKPDRPYFHRQLLRFKDQPLDSPIPVDDDQ